MSVPMPEVGDEYMVQMTLTFWGKTKEEATAKAQAAKRAADYPGRLEAAVSRFDRSTPGMVLKVPMMGDYKPVPVLEDLTPEQLGAVIQFMYPELDDDLDLNRP